MKILESMKNGIEYQNLYLKLCLLSLKAGGQLLFKDIIPYNLEMLSTILRVNIDTVKTGIEIFKKLQLVEILDNGIIFMSDIQTLIGHGSTEAERKAEYRKRIEENKGRTLSGQCLPELEIDIELEKKIDIKKNNGGKPPYIKKPIIGYKESVAKYFTLYENKMSIKPPWGKKEGQLLKSDLKRLSSHPTQKNYEILCVALESFFLDENHSVTEFAEKAGYTYGVFHSKLDSILNYLGRKN